MNRHLVTIKVSIEALADKWMQLDGISLNQNGLKGLNAHSMKSWSTIKKNRMVMNDLFENIPDFRILTLKHLLGTFNRVSMPKVFEAPNNERLIQFERNLLGKATLMEAEPWANDNNTSSGVIYSLAKQIFAKTSLLAFDHVSETF